MKKLIFVLVGILLFWGPTAVTTAQSPITFSDPVIENNFPDNLTFTITASSTAGEIESAILSFAPRNAVSTNQRIIEVEPGATVTLTYVWDTSNSTAVPSTPLFYSWEVTDSAGNRAESEETLVYYDDVRYDWQVLEDENIAVWTHDCPDSLGARVFEIAEQSLADQQDLFLAEIDYQMRIIIYNNFEEFAGWQAFAEEWVGGQAFSALGITTQIVNDCSESESWLLDVVPHEISHLYFFQATYHPISDPPHWLNEGVAQYNEISPNDYGLFLAQSEIEDGNLIPLRVIEGNFGGDDDQIYLSYAEGLSAVTFLVETYGSEGLSALMMAYKEGKSNAQAMDIAFGLTPIEFQTAWLEWLDIPPEMYPTPTPRPTVGWALLSPTPPPTRASSTATPTATAVLPTSTITAAPPTDPPATEVAQVATSLPATNTPPPLTTTNDDAGGNSLCTAPLLLVSMFLVWLPSKKRKQEKTNNL